MNNIFFSQKTVVQFIKFGIVGLSNTIISYLVYTILVYFGVYYLISSIIGFIVSVLNSFFWNNKYIFIENKSQSIFKSLLKTFASYAFTGLVLSNVLLYTAVSFFNISKYIAPLISLGITVPLNFVLNKFWAFRENKTNEKN